MLVKSTPGTAWGRFHQHFTQKILYDHIKAKKQNTALLSQILGHLHLDENKIQNKCLIR